MSEPTQQHPEAETALQDNEAFRHRIFESSRVPIVVIDATTWRYVDCNPAALEIYRFATREETLGKTPLDVSAPAQYDGTPSAEKARQYIEQALAKGNVVFEWRHRRPNGELWDAEVHLMSFRSGERQYLQFTLHDITERRRAQQVVQDSERKYRTLFNAASEAIFLAAEGRFVDCNPRTLEMFGCQERSQILGCTPQQFSPPQQADGRDSGECAREKIAAAEAGQSQFFEWTHKKLDGTPFIAEVNLNGVELEGRTCLLAIVRDITERKRSEEELRRREQLYHAVVKNQTEFIVQWRPDGMRTFANEAYLRYFGLTYEQAIGSSFLPLVSEADRRKIEEKIARLTSGSVEAETDEHESILPNGKLAWQEWTDTVIRDNAGRVVEIQSVGRDITDRKRAEEEKRQLESRLIQSQKMEAIGQLAGGVAHDFNNILMAILMHLNLLQEDEKLAPPIQMELKELEAEAQRAAALTRQLLLFGRRQIMQPQVFEFNSLLGSLLKMLRRLIGEDINLELSGASESFWIEADPGMVEQVILNLVVNARDAMPKGGRVTLHTGSVRFDDSVRDRAPEARPGRFVCLKVTDTGCGMDAGTIKHIFEPFFTTKAPGKGTGLGLATVYGIVRQHQGWAEVESTVGQGTTFSIFLPLHAQPPKSDIPVAPTKSLPRGTETLLFVEDDRSVRSTVSRMLQRLGYRVLEAGDASQALRLWTLHQNEIQLLLTDMVMPGGTNGLELAEQLLDQKPSLNAVLTSGYSAEIAQWGAPKSGRIQFLPKPLSASMLANAIRAGLDTKGTR